MFRLFDTHKIRKEIGLSEKLWQFSVGGADPQTVFVPSCWETYPGYESYRGEGLYQTEFEVKGNVRLYFRGVSHFARVFVDEKEIGTHYCSYTPFFFIVKGLPQGYHKLSVYVDNSFKPEYSSDIPNDYISYGGISRGVSCEILNDSYIENVRFTPSFIDAKWHSEILVYCRNLLEDKDLERDISIDIAGRTEKKRVLLKRNELTVVSFNVEFGDVLSWTIDNPNLYTITAKISAYGDVLDDLIDRVGFRTVKAEGTNILLNNRPVRIKGFCRHEDETGFGCALPASAISRDLMLVRDMGGNSVRTSHYPNDEIFLDMCDELGLLVWEENHARGLDEKTMRNPFFEPQAEDVIREMITFHYNHPSIYLWGILNECASDTDYGRDCYAAQYSLIRSLDQSRLCSSASCKFYADKCQSLPDVCSWNFYPYWYDEDRASDKIENIKNWIDQNGGNGKPFIISEIGAGAIYGFRSVCNEKWSEECQRDILEKQLTEAYADNRVSGLYIWQFCDVRVSNEWGLPRPKSRNNKGIVDEYRRPKLSYAVVKRIFSALPDYKED